MRYGAIVILFALSMYLNYDRSHFTASQDRASLNDVALRFQLVAGSHYFGDDGFRINKYREDERKIIEHGIVRMKITFLTWRNIFVTAVVYVPAHRSRDMPAVLCLPDYSKVKKGFLSGETCTYAIELANRGYVTLVPDYPGYGKYDDSYNPYIIGYGSYTMNAIDNHERTFSLLNSYIEAHSFPDIRINYSRIGCMGHASGGYNTLFLSLFARQSKVFGISSGITTFAKYNNGLMGNWSKRHLMPWIASKYDNDPKKIPFDFPELLASIAPKPLYVSCPTKDQEFNIQGARECVDKAKEAYAMEKASDMFVAEFPDCGQEFPKEVRERMYAFFDKHLKSKPSQGDGNKPK